MAEAGESGVPRSPETQPAHVREQLDQDLTTHEGAVRDAATAEVGSSQHLGAVESEVAANMPPVSGADDLVSAQSQDADVVDPAAEITPG